MLNAKERSDDLLFARPGADDFARLLHSAPWDALCKSSCADALFAALEGAPRTPLVAARLAQLHLRTGRKDWAVQALDGQGQDVLVETIRLHILAAWGDYDAVLERANTLKLAGVTGPLADEARVRALYAVAFASWGLRRYRRGVRFAARAAARARASGMPGFAAICEVLRVDCAALYHEQSPGVRERELRDLIQSVPSQEAWMEAQVSLLRLMCRQGRYAEAGRLGQALPCGRLGRHFRKVTQLASGGVGKAIWQAEPDSLSRGRLRALDGLFRLDAALILSGSPPPQAGLSERHLAEWQLAYGWAHLREGAHERALTHILSAFVPRSEWDLRLLRNAGLLELFTLAPQLVGVHCNALAAAEEALWLLRERVAPNSTLLTRLPEAVPRAVSVLAAAPGAVPEELGERRVALASPRGLRIGGVTRTAATAMLHLIAHGGRGPNASSGALRAARARLKRALTACGEPALVTAWEVARTLGALADLAGEDQDGWAAAAQRYAAQYGLT